MSGRTLHLRDGVLITNRKTDRRQSPKRPLLERLHDLNERAGRRYPATWSPDVRIGFLLPRTIEAFVASGPHGMGVNVHQGFVQITSYSSQQCFEQARAFLAVVAKDRPAFTVTASIISLTHPDRSCGRHLTVINGTLLVSRGHDPPTVYQARSA